MKAIYGVLILLLLCAGVQAVAGESYQYIAQWGGEGRGDGEFNGPSGIAVDNEGWVYVVDTGNYRFQKFTDTGEYIDTWGSYGDYTHTLNGFRDPWGIAVDSKKRLYIADVNNDRIQVWTHDGEWITNYKIGEYYDDWFPHCIAILHTDPVGTALDWVYVSDGFGKVTALRWETVMTWPEEVTSLKPFDSWGGIGTGDGLFDSCAGARGIAVDSGAYVYVTDPGHNRVQKFTPNGTYLTQWGTTGKLEGQFQNPQGIAVDDEGYVYVADTGNNRIQKFTKDGEFVTTWGSEGTGDGQFLGPMGIAVDADGVVFVTDYYNNRVQKFARGLKPEFMANVTAATGYAYLPNAAVQFTDLTTGGVPATWEWDFNGDGATDSTEKNPVYVYVVDGLYDVTLRVSNPIAGSSSVTKTDYIAVSNPDNSVYYVLHQLPCMVEAEDYDRTGAGRAYYDMTPSNEGGAYRADGVDIEPAPNGGAALCFIRDGEWTKYTVNSSKAGVFPVAIRVACWETTPSRRIEIIVDGVTKQVVQVLGTGSSSTFTTVMTQLPVPAGWHEITLMYRGGSMNVDSIFFGPPLEPVVIPGAPNEPSDLDDDGLCEDVNGNGRKDFADVVLYFNQMTWMADNEPLAAFDYNENDRIDFADVVWLFNNL